jgi:hypothetical protein
MVGAGATLQYGMISRILMAWLLTLHVTTLWPGNRSSTPSFDVGAGPLTACPAAHPHAVTSWATGWRTRVFPTRAGLV